VCAFNEYNEPTIEDTYSDLLEKGFLKIIVIPMFMALGMHLEEEIPGKLGIPTGSRGGTVDHNGRKVEICYAEPYGTDLRMNNLLVDRINAHVDP
jgi:sirohydrochlorin cobaltochelatase